MRLLAVSDLHASHPSNREWIEHLDPSPEDWICLVGDLGDTFEQVTWVLRMFAGRFGRVIWAPGNHDLWTLPCDPVRARGEERYHLLVQVCRDLGVVTPEDGYERFPATGETVVPLLLLHDFSFSGGATQPSAAIEMARRRGTASVDDHYLDPAPHDGVSAWCRLRLSDARARLDQLDESATTVLLSHFPLREDLVDLPAMPELAPWCGSTATEEWHVRYRASVVAHGHLHRPAVAWRDGVRFHEVSIGTPRDRRAQRTWPRLHQLLPGPPALGPRRSATGGSR